jgi:DNA-binding CsgD family transcriptional regulator
MRVGSWSSCCGVLWRAERAVAAYAGLGHSNKSIAYLLGIALSTAKRLATAEAKLGVGSRRVLIEVLGGR